MAERMRRVDQAVRAVLSDAIARDLKDPRVGFVTVTGVKTSPDLRHARVYVSVLGDEEASARFHIALDPRLDVSPEAVAARQELILRVFEGVATCHRSVTRIRRIRQALSRWSHDGDGTQPRDAEVAGATPRRDGEAGNADGLDAALSARATAIRASLRDIEDRLTVADSAGRSFKSILLGERMRLDNRLAFHVRYLAEDWGAVPRSARQVAEQLIAEFDAAVADLERVVNGPLAELEDTLREAGRSVIDSLEGSR